MVAYAIGRWDPLRTPNPPQPFFTIPAGYLPIIAPPRSVTPDPLDSALQNDSPPTDDPPSSRNSRSTIEDTSKLEGAVPTTSANRFRSSAPVKIPLPTYRIRNSFSTSSAPCPGTDPSPSSSTTHSNVELQTTVATMRWAAARVDISPLALPSPEHELTDPMRGVTATVPSSYLPEINQPDHPPTPGAIRKARSFWHGTTDVDSDSRKITANSTRLATIDSTPEADVHPNRVGSTSTHLLKPPPSISVSAFIQPHIVTPPATSSPGLHGVPSPVVDYFGSPHSEVQEPNPGTMTVPVIGPRRVSLARQTSSPLPVLPPRDPVAPGGRVFDSSIAGRAAKEEQAYAELGFLAPPNPPDELERRRALYKYDPPTLVLFSD
jgi:hypothetical protein